MRRYRTTTVSTVAVLSLLALPLAGCSDDGPPTPMPTQSSTAPTSSPSPSASASTGTPTPSSSASPSGTASVPAGFSLDEVRSAAFPKLGPDLGTEGAVRVGHHAGFDRVVWEFSGPDTPNYQVHYVDQPLGDGSGDPVDVAGDAYLEVVVMSLGYPDSVGACPPDATSARLAGTVFAEANSFCGGFEGVGQAFVGVRDHQRPFKVAVLTNPSRLVVDVYTG